jgi:ribonuclease R
MLIGSDGSVLDTQLYPSLIRSAARLDYGQVQRLLDGGGTDAGPHALPKPVTDRLFALDGLARKLLSRRLSRGAIDFDSQEAKLSLDADGRPLQVTLRQKTAATSLVEEAMILANEQVAAYMLGLQAPMAYRIHDQPLSATLAELVPTLAEFGYITKARAPESSKDIQAILAASAERPEHYLISSLLLRAMKQAHYSSAYSGHFGLASSGYCHFTSPIRRYPDLMAHRLLRYQLAEKPPPPGMLRQLDWICRHCSQMERSSELATRQATALKLCEYLGPRINEVFDTIIVSVSSFGLGLKEQSTTAEGDIQAADLPPGYGLDLGRQRFFDPSSNLSLRLGQPLRVRLAGVDPSRMRLRFVIA